jgi:hypothetical protein
MKDMTKVSLLISIALLVFISCNKKDINKNQSLLQIPKLYKTLDTLLSNQREDRVFYYYNTSGICDSMIYETQATGVIPPFWIQRKFRFEYLNDSLPHRIFRKDPNTPEIFYAEMEYSNRNLLKQLIYTDTIKYTYDAGGRITRDTQFNRFGIWDNAHSYLYDSRNNVVEYKSFSRFSPDSGYERYTYDSAINPFYKRWDLLPVSPVTLSPNNVTSGINVQLPSYSTIKIYQYNSFNLPVKSFIHNNGQAAPYNSITYFYQ